MKVLRSILASLVLVSLTVTSVPSFAQQKVFVTTTDTTIIKALKFQGTYSSGTAYAINDVVVYSGTLYYASNPSTGQIPVAGSSYWSVFSSGTSGGGLNWRGAYSSGTAYAVNDAVSYNGSSYIAVQAISAGTQVPAAGSYWNVLAAQGAAGSGSGSGGTIASGYGINATTSGSTTTLNETPNLNGKAGNTYYSTTTDTTNDGGGFVTGRYMYLGSATIGHSMGNAPSGSGNLWFESQGDRVETMDATAGTSQMETRVHSNFKIGDDTMRRAFWNFIAGGCKAASDECNKGEYLSSNPVNTYTGTINAGSGGTGATEIRTSVSGYGCAGVTAASDNLCTGGGHKVVRTGSPVATGHITAITAPSATALGVATVDFAMTPAAAIGTIPTITNCTSTFVAGCTLTGIPVTVTSGTIPSSAWACISGGFAHTSETVQTTLTSTNTITIAHHRYVESNNNGAGTVNIMFGAPCRSGSPEDEAVRGGRMNYDVIGVISSSGGTSQIAYTSYIKGQRGAPMLYGGGYGFYFRAGVTGHDDFSIFDSAEVLSAGDPLVVAANAALAPGLQPANPHNGYLLLTENPVTWNPGDAIELPYEPSLQYTFVDHYCNVNLPSSAFNSECYHHQISGAIDIADDWDINNQASVVNAAGGYNKVLSVVHLYRSSSFGIAGGAFNYLNQLESAPQAGLYNILNCAPGDITNNCANSAGYFLWLQNKSGTGYLSEYVNLAVGRLEVNHPTLNNGTETFGAPVTFNSSIYVGSSAGLSTTVTVGGCTLTYSSGILTGKSGC